MTLQQPGWDVIIIGTGAGGSAAAALAAHHGLKVLVLEKNPVVGGSLAHYTKEGVRLDVGSHLFSRGRKGPIGKLLKYLGISDVEFITVPVPSTSRGIFEIALPSTRLGLPGFMVRAIKGLKVPSSKLKGVLALFMKALTTTQREIESLDRVSLHDFILNYTDYAPVYYMFSFLMGIYFVLPPWEVSAGEALYCFSHQFKDYSLSYTKGGADAFIRALLNLVEAKGGRVLTMQKVQKVYRKKGLWHVVTREGEEFTAKAVISSAGVKDLLRIAEDNAFPQEWTARVKGIKSSLNAFQVKAVLKRKVVPEGCVIGGVSLKGIELEDLSVELLSEATKDVIDGRVPDPMALYAPVPTNFDPSLATGGRQVILATIYGPTREDPAEPPQKWEEKSLLMLDKAIPGFLDNLEFYDFFDIKWMGRWMGKTGNPAISTGQTVGQVGRDRPSVRTPLEGLYIAGDGAGGRGIGVELAVESAFEAVKALREDWERL